MEADEPGTADLATADEAHLTWGALPTRLDRAMREGFPEWGRSAIGEAIASRRVRVNRKIVWMSSWKVERGDQIVVHLPPKNKATGPQAFDPSWVVCDEGSYVVLSKPEGLRSERTRPEDHTPNLLSLARSELGDDLALAHRLDRDTSGLVLTTRPGPLRAVFDEMFRTHNITKRYEAIVHGPVTQSEPAGLGSSIGRIETYIASSKTDRDQMVVVDRGGKSAITDFEIVADWGESRRVNLWPRTGRTHQLRLHCAHRDMPILGDRLYGQRNDGVPRLMLHAASLSFDLNGTRTYDSPVPF